MNQVSQFDFSAVLGGQPAPAQSIPFPTLPHGNAQVVYQPQISVMPAVEVAPVQKPISVPKRAQDAVFFLNDSDPKSGFVCNTFYSPFVGTKGGERYI